ncbi:MAG: zeta toxin family protein [Oscillospiraceae bacterium]|nr:zeta toxin family protein [Oscillospiraceae bacterium]
MKKYTLIAGVNGTGKSSLRGVLEGQGELLGQIIDPDQIARAHHFDVFKAGKQAVAEIDSCLARNVSFTQETTLSGKRVLHTLRKARQQGYDVSLFYVGLNSAEESLQRIANRVRKGGHDIPKADVERRFSGRFDALRQVLPYCDQVTFYDNENGFVKVAEIRNGRFFLLTEAPPVWLTELKSELDHAGI